MNWQQRIRQSGATLEVIAAQLAQATGRRFNHSTLSRWVSDGAVPQEYELELAWMLGYLTGLDGRAEDLERLLAK